MWRVLLVAGLVWAGGAGAQSSFSQGSHDRAIYEKWFTGLTGSFREGAAYWAAHRSIDPDRGCLGPPGENVSATWREGCEVTRKTLDPFDKLRRTDASYKAGWNSQVSVRTDTGNQTSSAKSNDLKDDPFSSTASPPIGTDSFTVYETRANLAFGCRDPDNARAAGDQARNYMGYASVLIGEANAVGCYRIQPGLRLTFESKDNDSGSLLMRLERPAYMLGVGKITEIWVNPGVFVDSHN